MVQSEAVEARKGQKLSFPTKEHGGDEENG